MKVDQLENQEVSTGGQQDQPSFFQLFWSFLLSKSLMDYSDWGLRSTHIENVVLKSSSTRKCNEIFFFADRKRICIKMTMDQIISHIKSVVVWTGLK